MNQDIANPARVKPPSYTWVLLSGVATAALALFLVYLAATYWDFNPLGLYLNYILPAGAIGVGILAGSGYGLASWMAGIKVPARMLWVVMFLQCIAYFTAQYIQFQHLHLYYAGTNEPVGFFHYFDVMARSFAFKESNGETMHAMGVWGYAFRFLEMAGFAVAGIVIPLFVRGIPYCDACQRYMRRAVFAVLPGSAPHRKVKKSDAAGQADYQEEKAKAVASAEKAVQVLAEMAASGQMDALKSALKALRPGMKAANKLPVRHLLSLHLCRTCSAGNLNVVQVSGQGKGLRKGKAANFPVPRGEPLPPSIR